MSEIAVNGFKVTRIYPMNRYIFIDADYIAAEFNVGKTCSLAKNKGLEPRCSVLGVKEILNGWKKAITLLLDCIHTSGHSLLLFTLR